MFITVLNHYKEDVLCIHIPSSIEDEVVSSYGDSIENIMVAAGFNGAAFMVSDFKPKNINVVKEYKEVFPSKFKVGDKVNWFDREQQSSKVFEVVKRISDEIVLISNGTTETEVYETELAVFE